MARTDLYRLTRRNLPAGPRQTPEYFIPVGANLIDIGATRDNWPNTSDNIIELRLDFSPDGGKTWPHFIAMTDSGEPVLTRAGTPKDVTTWGVYFGPLPEAPNGFFNDPAMADANNPLRKVQGTITAKVALRTECYVRFE